MNVQNALLIQTAFIGDVVLTTPMIAAFKRFFPDARLTVMVKPEAAPILSENPAIDELLVFDKGGEHRGPGGMLRMLRSIRARRFDVLLSPHRSHRTALLAMRSGIPLRVGYAESGFARFAYTRRLQREKSKPEIHRLLDFLAESLEVPDARKFSPQLEVFVNDDARRAARELLKKLDVTKPMLIAPSSVWPTKRWTPWGFAGLIGLLYERYKRPILLVGSKGDREISARVLDALKLSRPDWVDRKVFDVCGATSLAALYALMEQSALLISNDSAPVHFGCAAKTPLVAIFGPTTPSLGYAPIAPRTAVAELDNLGCRPCGDHGAKRCPLDHFRCMKDLTPEMVMQRVEQVLS